MEDLSKLNYIIILYTSVDKQVLRIPCNFLLTHRLLWIISQVTNGNEEFYSHVELNVDGKSLIKIPLSELKNNF